MKIRKGPMPSDPHPWCARDENCNSNYNLEPMLLWRGHICYQDKESIEEHPVSSRERESLKGCWRKRHEY